MFPEIHCVSLKVKLLQQVVKVGTLKKNSVVGLSPGPFIQSHSLKDHNFAPLGPIETHSTSLERSKPPRKYISD